MGIPIPVGATPQLISRQVSKPYLIYNTGANTIYLGQDSSVSPTAYSFPLAPGNAFQWQEISTDVYGVTDKNKASLAVIAYEANALSLGSVIAKIPDPVDVSGSQVVVSGNVAVSGPVSIPGGVAINGPVSVAGNVNILNSVVNIAGAVSVPSAFGVLFSNNNQTVNPALTTIYQTNTGDLAPYNTLMISWGTPNGSGLTADVAVLTFLITWLSATGSAIEYQRVSVYAVGNSQMLLPIHGPNVLVRASINTSTSYTDALVVAGNSIALPQKQFTNPTSASYWQGGTILVADRGVGASFVAYRFQATAGATAAMVMLSTRSGKAFVRLKSPAAIDVGISAMADLSGPPLLSVNNGVFQGEVVLPAAPLVLTVNNSTASTQIAELFISYIDQ